MDVYIYNLSFRLVIPFNFRSGKYLYDYRTCIIRSTHAHNFAKESNGGSEEEEEKKKRTRTLFYSQFFFLLINYVITSSFNGIIHHKRAWEIQPFLRIDSTFGQRESIIYGIFFNTCSILFVWRLGRGKKKKKT